MSLMNELLIKDKFANLDQVAKVLEEEICPIARNFLLLSEQPVVRFRRTENGYVFNIEIKALRVKPFGAHL